MYIDDYETCDRTYVTLRIYCDSIHPDEITENLGILPTSTIIKGEKSRLQEYDVIKLNGWFLSTENILDSKDCRRHIDYLADKILPIKDKIILLMVDGLKIDLFCYWNSESGQGGPTISKQQFSKLADLEIDLAFDIY